MTLEYDPEAFESPGATSTYDEAGGQDSAELMYQVVGEDDHDAALDLVVIQVVADHPTFMGGRVVPHQVEMQEVGPETWQAKVKFKSINGREGENTKTLVPNQSKFSFDTTGGRFNITEALEQTKYGTDSADFGRRINVNGDSVDGTEIVIPSLTFQITQRFCPGTVNLAYAKTVANLTGSVNNAGYLGFDAGELLFMGASGGQQAEGGQPEVTFHFAASPNQTNVQYSGGGGTITVTSKKGHEYIWVHYVDKDDDTDTVKDIRGVYVARVYDAKDWSALGLVSPEATTFSACS